VPVGATGEVWVRSPTLMNGYLGDGDGGTTFSEDGWLRTGDLGTIDSRGYLILGGRLEDVIKCRGIKVFPRVVEEALTSHPDVSHAHVFAMRGHDEIEEVHAAVALRPEADLTSDELRAHVASALSPLHVPDVITGWSTLPVTANGKPDRMTMVAGSEAGGDRMLARNDRAPVGLRGEQ
jgi:fatty-acyl-CoA synthase